MVFLTILKCAVAIALAVGGAISGARWIAASYERRPDILSHGGDVYAQNKSRGTRLAAVLGFLFCFAALRIDGLLATLSALVLIYFCVLFTFTDLEQRVIFDRMMIPFALLGIFFTILTGTGIFNHIGAAVVYGLVFLLLSILTHGSMGGGDIKLIAALGLWAGSDHLLYIVLGGIILSGLAAFLLLATKRLSRKDYLPYAPGFTIAAIFVTLFC